MPKMVVLSQTGKELNEITLADTVFGIEPNQQCIFDAVIMQRASMRQGTHDTKNRTHRHDVREIGEIVDFDELVDELLTAKLVDLGVWHFKYVV